jgi:hypothetical protein
MDGRTDGQRDGSTTICLPSRGIKIDATKRNKHPTFFFSTSNMKSNERRTETINHHLSFDIPVTIP